MGCCAVPQGDQWVFNPASAPTDCFRARGGIRVDVANPAENYFMLDISQLTLATVGPGARAHTPSTTPQSTQLASCAR